MMCMFLLMLEKMLPEVGRSGIGLVWWMTSVSMWLSTSSSRCSSYDCFGGCSLRWKEVSISLGGWY